MSKDKQGKTKAIRVSLASSMVPVDRDEIKRLLEFLKQQEGLLLNKRPINIPRIEGRTKREQKDWIVRAKLQALGVLYSSSLKSLPDEHLLQCYRECNSGRLQGVGFHLQNLLREVKNTALAEKWDHDIESCHYTLTHQIANKHGYKAGAIEEYINNKDQIHQRFVDSYGISKDDTKKCMLSLIYGAPLTAYTGATIYRVLEEKSEVFKNDEIVQAVKKDLVKCKAFILGDGMVSRGKMKNSIGKWVSISKSQKSLASHILQGYEALALHTAIEELDGNILLLCHDGFVTEIDIDTSGVSQSFYEKTGLEISFKSEQLTSIANM